jgi:microcin C transport system ATP-binding protein
MEPVLALRNFSLTFIDRKNEDRRMPVLSGVTLAIEPGQTHALVGESGSGKSVTALSILRLPEESSRVETTGTIHFEGRDITALNREEMRALRGNRIAMIFQEPMTSLNPVYTIGSQLIEPLVLHQAMTRDEARRAALQLLVRTGIDNPI